MTKDAALKMAFKALKNGKKVRAGGGGTTVQPVQEPLGWHTEDHLTDRSATTYSKEMAYRWECKGWPVTPFYASPPKGL